MLYIYMYIQFQKDTIDMKVFYNPGNVNKMLYLYAHFIFRNILSCNTNR